MYSSFYNNRKFYSKIYFNQNQIYQLNTTSLKTNFIASFRAILSSADQANIILWQAPRSAIGMGQVIGTKLDQLQESRENIINYLNQEIIYLKNQFFR